MSSPVTCRFVDFWPSFTLSEYPLYRAIVENFEAVITNDAEYGSRYDEPEYLFYSVFGSSHVLNPRYDRCIKILVAGENVRHNFETCDYALSFDYLDDPRHCRWPLFAQGARALVRPAVLDFAATAASKTKFCNFLYSNGGCRERNDFFDLLSAYRTVDSGGSVKNNLGCRVGGEVAGGYNVASKLAFQAEYKFTIAFENASHDGYVTEKISDPLSVHSIPIYWGSRRVTEDFNPGAFINCHDYDCWADVVRRVIAVDRDEELYRQYLEEPPFLDNRLPACCEPEYLISFLRKIFSDHEPRKHDRLNLFSALSSGGWSAMS
jgi:hypothetical protein